MSQKLMKNMMRWYVDDNLVRDLRTTYMMREEDTTERSAVVVGITCPALVKKKLMVRWVCMFMFFCAFSKSKDQGPIWWMFLMTTHTTTRRSSSRKVTCYKTIPF